MTSVLSGLVQIHGQNLVNDGSFESPVLGYGNFHYGNINGSGWRFITGRESGGTGGSGITHLPSIWSTSLAPIAGNQVGLLQSVGSWISQSVTLPAVGIYELQYFHAGRNAFQTLGGDLTYSVKLDSTILGTFSTMTGQDFSPVTLRFTAPAGEHSLSFFAIDNGGLGPDQTAFIDAVHLIQVPEPKAVLLAIFGLSILAFTSKRRSL
jgi:hypothetical protein